MSWKNAFSINPGTCKPARGKNGISISRNYWPKNFDLILTAELFIQGMLHLYITICCIAIRCADRIVSSQKNSLEHSKAALGMLFHFKIANQSLSHMALLVMGQPCPGLSQEPSRPGRGQGGRKVWFVQTRPLHPCNFSSFQRQILGTFWVPLQWAGIVAQNCSHFSDDYLPVLLRFQLLVSCIMDFISSLSSVHKFSIYFHPCLRYSSTCKAEKVLFFPLLFWSLIPLKHSSSFFATKRLFQGLRFTSSCCRFLGTPRFQQHLCWLQSSLPAATLSSLLLVRDQLHSWDHSKPAWLMSPTPCSHPDFRGSHNKGKLVTSTKRGHQEACRVSSAGPSQQHQRIRESHNHRMAWLGRNF